MLFLEALGDDSFSCATLVTSGLTMVGLEARLVFLVPGAAVVLVTVLPREEGASSAFIA